VEFICQAVLFDLDGVLVDSSTCVENAWRRWAKERGLPVERVLEAAHGYRSKDTVAIVAAHLDAAEQCGIVEQYELASVGSLCRVPGAAELVSSMASQRWAIVTSGSSAIAAQRLRFAGIPIPGTLITAEAVISGKPSPEGYLKAAASLRFSPDECVVVEDAPSGIEAARAAGMKVIAVALTHAPPALGKADAIIPALENLRVESTAMGIPRLSLGTRSSDT
jgi:mannitol-1-/sugar-/sorbitol-6-phosphatase